MEAPVAAARAEPLGPSGAAARTVGLHPSKLCHILGGNQESVGPLSDSLGF